MSAPLKHKRRLPILEHYRALGAWRWLMLALIIAGASLADYLAGTRLTFREFYLIPVLLVAAVDGQRPSLVVAAVCALISVAVRVQVGEYHGAHLWTPFWDAAVACLLFGMMAVLVFRLSRAVSDEHFARQHLLEAYIELDKTRKDQLLLKDQLLSHVSHELRTPLNSAYQFVAILRDGLSGPLSEEQDRYIKIIERNLAQLTHMIRDLLDSGRVDSGKLSVQLTDIELGPLIQDTVASLAPTAREKSLILQVVPIPPGIFVHTDPARVRQILLNLLDNAIKFTAATGYIIVRTEDPAGGRIAVSVIDTGKGITLQDRQHLFDRLYQVEDESGASRRGLGLGLYICKQLVEVMGGEIEVSSAPGAGSTFTFTLPLTKERVAGETAAA